MYLPRGRFRLLLSVALTAAFLLCIGAPSSQAATVKRLEAGRSDIAIFMIDGNLAGGETVELQRQVAKLPANLPVSVLLNSPGGSVSEGFQLGEFFYKAGISTFVLGYGHQCSSACALAFLGGRDAKTGRPSRVLMAGGKLGFHQFHLTFLRSDEAKNRTFNKADVEQVIKITRSSALETIKYLTEIREDISKLHLVLKAPASGIHNVTTTEALSLGIHVMGDEADELVEASVI